MKQATILKALWALLGVSLTAALPLLQIGHHPIQQERQHRRRSLIHTDEEGDDDNATNMTNLDGADCNTSSIPQQLVRLENSIPTGRCVENWVLQKNNVTGGIWYYYPNDFEGITNEVEHYLCPATETRSKKRVFFSNGFPDHSVRWDNPNTPCEKFWYIEMPGEPEYMEDHTLEPPSGGIVAIAVNGMPIYGPQEAQAVVGNALEPNASSIHAVFDAQFWYGHSTGAHVAHYHNPAAGKPFIPAEDTLLGYALDGFPLYGPVNDTVELDICNGRFANDSLSSYRYHVRTLEQVNENTTYCPAEEDLEKPYIQWNYIVGCYHGNASETVIKIFSEEQIADLSFPTNSSFPYPDCTAEPTNDTTESPDESASSTPSKPNIIIIQPDDLPFYDNWGPPPNNPSDPDQFARYPLNFSLPSIERLRTHGIQLRQAYAASSSCGTSRYSTLTGKYPSRAASNREAPSVRSLAKVTIPKTKLVDVDGVGADCSEENLAVAMKSAGYRTAVVGKWHLFPIDPTNYTYVGIQQAIRNCSFDFAEGIYPENLADDDDDGILAGQHHNMEWLASKAIEFIQEDSDDPFLLYFNPTVPHSGGNVYEALQQSCRDTPGKKYDDDFIIKGMTLEYGNCSVYRDFVESRATAGDGNITDEAFRQELGAIWLDDAIGALIHALVDRGIFDNTMIIFQQDHGLEAKNSLFENGGRIAQFVHYPDYYGIEGSESQALVSTIDIAPTIMDFAGITPPYELDGQSWRYAIKPDLAGPPHVNFFEKERCLFFEYQRDRAVRCGCGKLMRLSGVRLRFNRTSVPVDELAPTAAPTTLDDFTEGSATFEIGIQGEFFDGSVTEDNPSFLFDLCTEGGFVGDYVTADSGLTNPEAMDLTALTFPNTQAATVRNQLQATIVCFSNITNATIDPIFNRNCSLDKYRPVCESDEDCQWHSAGRTTCSPAGFCSFGAAPGVAVDIDEPGGSDSGLMSTRVIMIVAVAALAVFLAAMFLRCMAIALCRSE